MVSRCGCAGTCACILTTDSSLSLSGTGSTESPWILRAVPDCAATMQCVGSSVDAPLAVNNGRLAVGVSNDDDQVLTTGSDGGLFVPGCVAGAVAIDDTPTIDLEGSGQTGNPLIANWRGAATAPGSTGVTVAGNGTPDAPLQADYRGVWMKLTAPPLTVAAHDSDVLDTWSMVNASLGDPFRIGSPATDLICQVAGFYQLIYRRRMNNTGTIAVGDHINAYVYVDGAPTSVSTIPIYGTNISQVTITEFDAIQVGQTLRIGFDNVSNQNQSMNTGSLWIVRQGATTAS